MQKILLYYKFAPLDDVEAVKLWQRTLCEKLDLRGRILIAEHGINGTVGGEVEELKTYIKETKKHPKLKGTVFKWSEGSRQDFPKLIVKIRPEIVTFNVADKIKVDDSGIINGGIKLKPEQVHKLVEERGLEEVVFFDGRNSFEAEIGKFKNAVIPDVNHTRDFAAELQKDKYSSIKDKPVVTYCTGGIRCEVLSMLMKDNGFKEVYQIDGGIVKYGEQYGDNGLWEGALYVFDDRIATKFSETAKDIGKCIYCKSNTSSYYNCSNTECNKRMLLCDKDSDNSLCPDCNLAVKAKS